MCGIVGYVSHPRCDRATLVTMASAIAHRGPDDEAFYVDDPVGLGYRRLAIIDLSPLGNQPVVSSCGRYVMVYNGEIYNYIELREELTTKGEVFRGQSDSEVLLAAFRYWGEGCLSRLNGMWAFVIWDRTRKRLIASRDRFGKKPFYFHRLGEGLIFASEVKALLATRLVSARPDLASVADFAAERASDHRSNTFFAGIEQLRPGHVLTWEGGRLDARRYWRPDPAPVERGSNTMTAEELGVLLSDAVRIRLRADTPVGILLSGGLDSSAVSCLAALQRSTGLSSFSTVDPLEPVAESEGIRHVSDAFPSIQIHRDFPDGRMFIEDLERCLWHQEEPFADGSMVVHYRLMRIARQTGTKVLLTGQGADEMFAGYGGFLGVHLADLVRRRRVGEALKFMTALMRSHQQVPMAASLGYLSPRLIREQVRFRRSRGDVDWLVPEARMVSHRVARGLAFRTTDAMRAALVDCVSVRTLPAFLHYEDRNSMAHGVETRLPYLDYRIAESALSLPGSVLLEGGKTKAILREAMKGIVPIPILSRLSKQGYPAPIGRWLRGASDETWSDWSGAMEACPLILAEQWRSHRNTFMRGDEGQLSKVWRGLALALWYRRFVTGVT